jgi:hypothetical protein
MQTQSYAMLKAGKEQMKIKKVVFAKPYILWEVLHVMY